MHTYIHTYIHIHSLYTHSCIHTYIHAYIHTYIHTFIHTGKIGVLNFENEEPVIVEEGWNSKYVAVFDPLDGSSNIDVGIVTGTIFGIFKEEEECLTDFGEQVPRE